ncbi:MAG: response regulator [Alphaproteobacteria bacterium]|nr:response regulator [Alphaproteobacteria bacterium]
MNHDILVVDDEVDIRLLISGVLRDEGYTTREVADAETALKEIDARRPSLAILDIWLQGSKIDGMELLSIVRTQYPEIPVVVISGHGNIETAVAAIKRGAYDYIEKPFKTDRLLLVVERAIEAARLRRENLELRQRAGNVVMIGDSVALKEVRAAIARVAPTNSRVLITGPAGAGKEVVARMIHGESPRASEPFVAINCAAMRPDRLEIELFGAESGVEGPGLPRHSGVFENADKGTLFLDEVADMPLETQGKIVRALQEQTFERVGGSNRIQVDVRVIAATSRELEALMEQGDFREDLYYRLNVVPIRVPPLSARREDIPALIAHFMERSARSSGLSERRLGDDALAALQAYDWPGNVRQLRNVVEWLLIMAPGDEDGLIHVDALPPNLLESAPRTMRGTGAGEIMGLDLRSAREIFEREYLAAQLNRFGGNISRTSEFIGMERSALHRKLKSLGLGGGDAAK